MSTKLEGRLVPYCARVERLCLNTTICQVASECMYPDITDKDLSYPLYQVWFIPTELGKTSFGWSLKAVGKPTCQDDAELEAYCWSCDARTPDDADYFRYRALPLDDA